MSNLIKNVTAILLAIIAAAILTFCVITLGHSIIPPPEGIDTNDFESIRSNFHLFKVKHHLFPVLAHGLGTLTASYIVSRFANSYKFVFAIGIGIIFMLASLSLTIRIGHFNWIGVIEIAQYIPISFLGYKIWQRTSNSEIIDK